MEIGRGRTERKVRPKKSSAESARHGKGQQSNQCLGRVAILANSRAKKKTKSTADSKGTTLTIHSSEKKKENGKAKTTFTLTNEHRDTENPNSPFTIVGATWSRAKEEVDRNFLRKTNPAGRCPQGVTETVNFNHAKGKRNKVSNFRSNAVKSQR